MWVLRLLQSGNERRIVKDAFMRFKDLFGDNNNAYYDYKRLRRNLEDEFVE